MEPGILCMIGTYSRERALELMEEVRDHYAKRGTTVLLDDERLEVRFPNGSVVRYTISPSSKEGHKYTLKTPTGDGDAEAD